MTQIHPLAFVDPAAEIDPTAIVSAFSVIEAGARIGPRTFIASLCHIWANTMIGAECEIHSGAMIGGTPQDRTFRGQPSGCEIGDGSVVREHVTVHRGTAPGSVTRVGKRCLLMAGSHVGHNCVVEDYVTLINGALLGGYVHVGPRAVVSGNVTVHQFVRIGEGAMVGASSKITQDVVPYFMVDGHGLNVGINRLGLRRMKAESREIEEIKLAYHVLCRERHSLPAARQLLQSELCSQIGQTILSFLASDSRRGFHLHGVNHRRANNTAFPFPQELSTPLRLPAESVNEHAKQ